MENELLCQILDKLNSLEDKIDTNFTQLNSRIDALDVKTAQLFNELSKDIARVVSDDVSHIMSAQLQDIKTEVSIIKSAVGEHELDLKYFKKVTIPNFKSSTI